MAMYSDSKRRTSSSRHLQRPRSSAWQSHHGRTQRTFRGATPQMAFFNAAAGKAFTIFLAGFALTTTTFPKTSLFPAFVAGFMRVLILHSPGTVKMPLLFTSFAH